MAMIVAALAVVLAGCAPSTAPATTRATAGPPSAAATATGATPVTPSATPAGEPVGIIAIGHSGLTGESIDALGTPSLEKSWATGSAPNLNSVYQRLITVRPEFEGHVANTAVGGARVGTLGSQANQALGTVPTPALVIIQTMDNDLVCGADEGTVAAFGATLLAALELVAEMSPGSVILAVSQPGRPERYAAQLADHPDIRLGLGGPGGCDMFDPSGALVPEKVGTLTATIERYEAELARVCALVPQCRTDDGIFTTYQDDFGDLVRNEWGHLNFRGQQHLAELLWPKVMEVLGLG